MLFLDIISTFKNGENYIKKKDYMYIYKIINYYENSEYCNLYDKHIIKLIKMTIKYSVNKDYECYAIYFYQHCTITIDTLIEWSYFNKLVSRSF